MEEKKLVQGQTIYGEGERVGNFYRVLKGRIRYGKYEYGEGDLFLVVEFFAEKPADDVVTALVDSTIAIYETKDLEDDRLFEELLLYVLGEIEKVFGVVKKDVVKDLEMGADVVKIAETAVDTEEDYALEVLEKMLELRELPTLPDDESKAFEILQKTDKEEDPLKYALQGIAFAKKFPDSIKTPELLLDVAKVYMEDLGDRYGAKYALKLLLLFQPNSEVLNKALRYIVKILRADFDPEWFEYLLRFMIHFPEEEVRMDEIS